MSAGNGTGRAAGDRAWRGLAVAAVVINLLLGCHFVGLWFTMERGGVFYRADFTPFYTAWTIMLKGEGASLYDPGVQFRVQQEVLAREGKSFPHLNGVANPPHALLPLAWLGRLPRDAAYKLWVIGLLVLHGVALAWCLRLFSGWGRLEKWVMVSTYAGFMPVFWGVAQGAFSAVGVLATAGGWAAVACSRRSPWPGFWLAATAVKPQLLLGPLCYHLGARSRVTLAVFAALSGVAAIVTTAYFGIGIWADNLGYMRELALEKDIRCVSAASMINLRGMLTIWMGETSGLANAVAAVLLPVGCLAAVALGRSRRIEPRLRYALAILLCLFLAPHLTIQDAALLLVPACLIYDESRSAAGAVGRRFVAALVALAPSACLLLQPGVDLSAKARGPALILVALLVWAAARSRPGATVRNAGGSSGPAR